MDWKTLDTPEQLNELDVQSATKPLMIYKHSTRCGVSLRAKRGLESDWLETDLQLMTPLYLDLLQHRDLSNALSANYKVPHESPQVLLIKNGQCIYSASHHEIDVRDMRAALQSTS
jgi:bacillithiol system protein YtxJ